jgi:alpha-D-xyloside xylohydrolase
LIEGPLTFHKEFPLNEYPVYIKEGAIIPMNIERAYTGIGDENSKGYLTFLIYPDIDNDFTVYSPGSGDKTVILVKESRESVKISLEGEKRPHILKIHLSSKPKAVTLDEVLVSFSPDCQFDENSMKLTIKTHEYSIGEYIIMK